MVFLPSHGLSRPTRLPASVRAIADLDLKHKAGQLWAFRLVALRGGSRSLHCPIAWPLPQKTNPCPRPDEGVCIFCDVALTTRPSPLGPGTLPGLESFHLLSFRKPCRRPVCGLRLICGSFVFCDNAMSAVNKIPNRPQRKRGNGSSFQALPVFVSSTCHDVR